MLDESQRAEEAPNPDEEIVTVGSFSSIVEADLVRSELEAAGIEAWAAGATIAQTFISMPETGITIQVAASNADRARQIVEELNSANSVPESDTASAPTMYDDAEAGG